MRHLKQLLVVCAIVLGAAMGLRANTAPVDAPALQPCDPTGNFQMLMSAHRGTCTIGDKIFSGFTFMSSASNGAHALHASQLDYQVINDGTKAIGFSFSGAINAGHLQHSSVAITYEVSGPGIIDAQASISGHGSLGNGQVIDLVCLGGPSVGCPSANLRTLHAVLPAGPSTATIAFSPVDEVGFNKSVIAFGSTGSFDITHFSETVSQVPEPGTLLLFGTGLLLLILIVSRKQLRTGLTA